MATLVCGLALVATLALNPWSRTAVADDLGAGTPLPVTATATATATAIATATAPVAPADESPSPTPTVSEPAPPDPTTAPATVTPDPTAEVAAAATASPTSEPPTAAPTATPAVASPTSHEEAGTATSFEGFAAREDETTPDPAASPGVPDVGTPAPIVAEADAVTVTALAEEDAAQPGETVALRYRLGNANAAAMTVVLVPTNTLPRWTAEVYTVDGTTPIDGPITIPAEASVEVIVLVRVPPEARLDDRNTTTLDALPVVGGD